MGGVHAPATTPTYNASSVCNCTTVCTQHGNCSRCDAAAHPIEKTGKELRARMSWLKPGANTKAD